MLAIHPLTKQADRHPQLPSADGARLVEMNCRFVDSHGSTCVKFSFPASDRPTTAAAGSPLAKALDASVYGRRPGGAMLAVFDFRNGPENAVSGR
jgi:hypothetical protein